jgi:hypothetical protein
MKLLLCLALGSFAFAQEHPNFSGTWQLAVEKSELHSKPKLVSMAIRQDESSITIDEQVNNKTVSMTCGTDGKNCKAKPEGESGEVMFYYNGALLVETDFFGHDKDRVVKKRLKMGGDGKTMEIEVLHMNPAAPAEKWVFAKQ